LACAADPASATAEGQDSIDRRRRMPKDSAGKAAGEGHDNEEQASVIETHSNCHVNSGTGQRPSGPEKTKALRLQA